MLFLIEYDRKRGSMVSFRAYDDGERQRAEDARLDLELRLNAVGINNEVVLLEAPNEDTIRRTHRRYFESLEELLETPLEPSLVRERPPETDSAN